MAKLFVVGGPEEGKSFQLRKGSNYVGRSSQDIQIKDPTVSRRHLKITTRAGRFYLTDLKSKNRTFFNGKYLAPSFELEVREGIPIAIGMTVLCIGEDCLEEMSSLLNAIGLTGENVEKSGLYEIHKDRTNQKKLELLYIVSSILEEGLPINRACQKILDYIFILLQKIDRCMLIFTDPLTNEITETISKLNPDKNLNELDNAYLRETVHRIMADKKPLVISNVKTEKDDLADTLKVLKIESLICVPMHANSEIVGFLYLDSLERPYGFRAEDVSLFMDLGRRIALAVQYSKIETEISSKSDVTPDSS